MKKCFIKSAAAVTALCGVLSCSLSAYATTVDDVARVARECGYSEDMIQQGYNEYYAHPEKYTSADFDYAIQQIYESNAIFTTAPQVPTAPPTTTTTTAPPAPSDNGSQGTTPADNPNNSNETGGGVTLQNPDGSTFTRISAKDFINMSYDEKMNYIRTFTPEQQQIIYDNLTPEERKSMLKQLPVEQKAEYVDSMAKFAETFDINVSVEEISDDNVSLAMRNDEGELIGMANAGVIVEDTGYDRRGIFAVSAGLIAFAGVLTAVAYRFLKRNGDENEG